MLPDSYFNEIIIEYFSDRLLHARETKLYAVPIRFASEC